MLKSAVTVAFFSFIGFHLYSRYISITIDTPDEEYDFIIVGGGNTGSVVASRLAENKTYRILVLEAGPEDGFNPLLNIPIFGPLNKRFWYDWKYATVTQKNACNARKDNVEEIMRGKVLGGTSYINFHLYNRGSRENYDSWGLEGWSYDDLLPYFLKSESSRHIYSVEDVYHGKDGPLQVTHAERIGLTDKFISAAKERGLKYIDHNGKTITGVSTVQTTVKNGLRQSAAKSYLRPAVHSSEGRLHVVVDAHVTKVVLKGDAKSRKRAVAVKYEKNGKEMIVKAKKEVIISAGAYGSPQILMLSGIGPKDHLEHIGIPVMKDLPGVGSNLHDHPFVPMYFYANNLSSNDAVTVKTVLYSLPGYMYDGSGPLSSFGGAVATVASEKELGESSEKKDPQPNFQIVMLPYVLDLTLFNILHKPDSEDEIGFKDGIFSSALEKAKRERGGVLASFFMLASVTQPKSSGTVRLKSSNPHDYPIIDPNLYSHPDDVTSMKQAIKWAMDLTTTKPFQEIGLEFNLLHSMCDVAKQKSLDEYLNCIARADVNVYHPACTAKMGSATDRMAVVDPQLRVHGVDGLRVADTSIMPNIVSTPLQATCYMIGEKVSDIIKGSWR